MTPAKTAARALTAALFASTLSIAPYAHAQEDEEAGAEEPVAEAEAGEATEPRVFQAIVRGFFVQAKVGGGLVVVDDEVGPNNFNPPVPEGASEGLGGGLQMGLTLGYDISDFIALQLDGGAIMVSGTRNDIVRDLGLYYTGVSVKLTFDLDDRLKFTLAPGGAFVIANKGVGGNENGAGIQVSSGIEYFAHVRHFSVGLELQVFVPLSPFRMFIGLTPTLKYTF